MMKKIAIFFILVFMSHFSQVYAQSEKTSSVIRVGIVLHQPPFSYESKAGVYDGVSIKLWEKIAAKLKLNYKYIPLKTSNDMSALSLSENNLDIIVSPLSVEFKKMDLIDYSRPYFLNKIGVAVSSVNKSKYTLLLVIFSKTIVIMLVVLSVLISLVGFSLWLVEKAHNNDIPQTFFKGVGFSMWISLGSFLRFMEYKARTIKGRVILTSWLFFAITFMTSITAVATASLTLSLKESSSSIKKLSDINNQRIAVDEGGAAVDFARDLGAKVIKSQTSLKGLKLISKGDVIGFMGDYYLMNYLIKSEGIEDIKMVPLTIANDEYAFGYPKNSPLKSKVNKMIVKFQDNNVSAKLCSQYLGKAYAQNCNF
jgi:polar amino acid transport system substrate-binding protein